MKKTNKKGFTIVELVIVIAVVAILAAVLIPTFVSVVNKANVSNDTALVKNINITLAAEEITDGKPATMHDALVMAERGGFDVSKLTPRSSGDIVWDSATNRFALVDKDGKKVFSENDKDIPQNASVWKIVKDLNGAKGNTKYSSYLAGDNATGDVEVSTGFDAGKNMGLSTVTYNTTNEQNVVIRTNGGKFVVNAANSHVEHYYIANEVDVQAVSDSTYVEYGVVGKMTVAAGKKVAVKPAAVVGEIDNKNTNNDNITNEGFVAKMPGETGKETNVSVSTYEQLQGLALASTVGVELKTINITNDIDLTGKAWQPFGYNEQAPFKGTIDGGNHTIKGLSPNGYVSVVEVKNLTNGAKGHAYGFITIAKDAAVKNIKFVDVDIDIADGLAVGAVVGDARGRSLTIENVTVSGSVKGQDKIGGFVGLAGYFESTEFTLTIKNSTNNANIEANRTDNYNRAGGFVGALGDEGCKLVTFNECTNNGSVTVTGNISDGSKNGCVMAGGFIGAVNGHTETLNNKIKIEGKSTNTGTITAINTATNGEKTVTGSDNTVGNKIEEKLVSAYPLYSTKAE
mgnify:CR=1 FL=1